jgi:hypothetical protein
MDAACWGNGAIMYFVDGVEENYQIIYVISSSACSRVVGDKSAELPHPHHSVSLQLSSELVDGTRKVSKWYRSSSGVYFSFFRPFAFSRNWFSAHFPPQKPTTQHNTLTPLRRPFGTQIKATVSSKLHSALPCSLVTIFLAYRTTFNPFENHNPCPRNLRRCPRNARTVTPRIKTSEFCYVVMYVYTRS